MIKIFLPFLLVFVSFESLFATQKYTISVCMTLSLENALICKKRIFDNMDGKVFIVKDIDEKYYTYIGIFDNKNDAKLIINKASTYVKEQKPYVKTISEEVVALYSKKRTIIDLNEVSKDIKTEENFLEEEKKENFEEIENKIEKNQESKTLSSKSSNPKTEEFTLVSLYPFYEGQELVENDYIDNRIQTKEEESKNITELTQVSMEEFDRADDDKELKKQEEQAIPQDKKTFETNQIVKKEMIEIVVNNPEDEPSILNYDELIIEVDPNTNLMTINAKINNELKEIKEYSVSTAKKDVKRPFGEGRISKISLDPIWYPTQDTLKSFRKRGINLPSVVPSGHKYNYMGAAKINLTHIVDGKSTYRIHGTLSEKTIGSNESAGCIRMKNSDVLQLVSLINDFSEIKGLNKVKVILK